MEQDNNNINKSNNNNENKNGGAFFNFSPKRSIAERRGFNKNRARRFVFSGFGATNSLVSPAAQSPTALLDSPIMLPNSQAMPSPTTGSLAMLPPLIDEGSMIPSIKFKPQVNLGPNSLSLYHASLNQVSSGVHFDNDVKMVNDMFFDTSNVDVPISCSEEGSDKTTLIHDEDIRRQLVLEEEQKEIMSHATEGKTSEDGYNWRKYGQKQVKGSEYPRSYYKCTHPNCQVKKNVERSHDGQITQIIYRGGNHNHAIPHSSRRGSSAAPSNDEMSDIAEANETCYTDDVDSVWGKDAKHDQEWKPDGGQKRDPRKRFRSLGMYQLDNAEERYSTLANHNVPLEDDVEDAESKLKTRKKESHPCETMVPSRVVREPRVVVQIESEVDILDDGYRWRKYGQKVVKGNPNPRSYYKCTSARCTVKKHVERASHNLKYVITTYEGKHNHEVPTARNNNQISSNDIALPSSDVNMQLFSIPKFETCQTLAPHFNNEFMRSSLMGSFSNYIKFGPSSMSQMKYSSLNNIKPYVAYGTSLDSSVAPQAEPIASIFPEFPMLLPSNLPSSAIFSLSGIVFNYAKPLSSVQSYLSGQHMNDIDTRFLRSKQH